VRPLPQFAVDAGLEAVERRFAYEREAMLFGVRWQGQDAVLRGLEVGTERQWLHAFLDELSATDFPAPRPLAAFAGDTLVESDGHLWELLTWIPGVEVAWSPAPTMEDVGAFLATYHQAVSRLSPTAQRPGATPMADVAPILLEANYPETNQLVSFFADELTALERSPNGVVHGDPTNMNVMADGEPPRPSGLIDFGGAFVDDLLVDLGCGLWQSGRPEFASSTLDPNRVAALMTGYRSVRPIPNPRAVPVYLLGRGLQVVAKRARLGVRFLNPMHLDRLKWIREHFDQLERAASPRPSH
jgi:Ser/Thr protein kinase RdoA (MazF antagonist)